MDDTWFYLPSEKEERLVTVLTKEDEEWVNFSHPAYNGNYPVKGAGTFYSGGSGMCSTAEDYAKFLQMYLNEGEYIGTRILSRTTVKSIMLNQMVDLWEGRDSHYGLAFGVLNERGEAKGGNGSAGTFNWGVILILSILPMLKSSLSVF